MNSEPIKLTKQKFLLFNQDDQFGFFYDEDGWPTVETDDELKKRTNELYKQYDYILVNSEDAIYGVKDEKKELIMDWADEGYSIALEVMDE